ncbi:MAG: VWA domain-containing protein [Planctomycetota bacterium]
MRGARTLLAAAMLAAPLALGCTDARNYDQAICALVDVSGTYADEKAEVVRILKRDVLPALLPGDTLLVIRIDSESYQKENLEALVTLDARPSRANAQKLALARKLDAFASRDEQAEYTDIPGAMMLGAEYLRELEAGSRVMLVFSDMREDLPVGAKRRLAEAEFEGIELVAVNVKRLAGDTANPEIFRGRLDDWERRVTGASAVAWRTFPP